MTPTKERAEHTRGPWHTGVINGVMGTEIFAGETSLQNGIASVWNIRGDEVDMANARLIAAAPDGLEAAERAYLALLRAGSSYRLRVQAELIALRNFIAKATGRSEQDVQETAESVVVNG